MSNIQIGQREKVKTKELAIFTRQFSVMLDAGLPLVQCLEVLAQQQTNPYFAKVLNSVRGDVNKAVDAWRSDIEKRFKVVRGTVDKRVTTLRKETQSRGRRLVDSLEKETRRYVERAFKQLKLPVRGDLEALKRRVSALERRLEEIEKTENKRAVA